MNRGGWELRQSVPELEYVKEDQFFSVRTINLLSAERRRFTVLIIECPWLGVPGYDFMLVYLRDPTGAIVDWKSQWLYNRQGRLKVKVLDVNHDGVPELCFVCQPFRRPEQLLSAFCVRNGKFEPVVAEHKSTFEVRFEETVLEGGLVIQPQFKGRYGWQTDRLYEIPAELFDRSEKPIDLLGRYIWLSPSSSAGGSYGALDGETLNPGAVLETVITVWFPQAIPDRTFGFELTPQHEGP